MTKKVLTEEEVKKVKDFQQKLVSLTSQLGEIEVRMMELKSQKSVLNEYFLNIRKEEQTLADELEKKYGKGSISLETGEFLPVE
tara:strand:+ start:562 stop:813 length:252 start_codon:yes stop_codon:yes gene_type:complete